MLLAVVNHMASCNVDGVGKDKPPADSAGLAKEEGKHRREQSQGSGPGADDEGVMLCVRGLRLYPAGRGQPLKDFMLGFDMIRFSG